MKRILMAVAVVMVTGAMQAQVVVKHLQPNEKSPIANGVWAGDTLYLSGQLADPVTPADAAKGTPAVYGDTKAQAFSALTKIQVLLKAQGLDTKDVVKMTVFLAGDPEKGGKRTERKLVMIGPIYAGCGAAMAACGYQFFLLNFFLSSLVFLFSLFKSFS